MAHATAVQALTIAGYLSEATAVATGFYCTLSSCCSQCLKDAKGDQVFVLSPALLEAGLDISSRLCDAAATLQAQDLQPADEVATGKALLPPERLPADAISVRSDAVVSLAISQLHLLAAVNNIAGDCVLLHQRPGASNSSIGSAFLSVLSRVPLFAARILSLAAQVKAHGQLLEMARALSALESGHAAVSASGIGGPSSGLIAGVPRHGRATSVSSSHYRYDAASRSRGRDRTQSPYGNVPAAASPTRRPSTGISGNSSGTGYHHPVDIAALIGTGSNPQRARVVTAIAGPLAALQCASRGVLKQRLLQHGRDVAALCTPSSEAGSGSDNSGYVTAAGIPALRAFPCLAASHVSALHLLCIESLASAELVLSGCSPITASQLVPRPSSSGFTCPTRRPSGASVARTSRGGLPSAAALGLSARHRATISTASAVSSAPLLDPSIVAPATPVMAEASAGPAQPPITLTSGAGAPSSAVGLASASSFGPDVVTGSPNDEGSLQYTPELLAPLPGLLEVLLALEGGEPVCLPAEGEAAPTTCRSAVKPPMSVVVSEVASVAAGLPPPPQAHPLRRSETAPAPSPPVASGNEAAGAAAETPSISAANVPTNSRAGHSHRRLSSEPLPSTQQLLEGSGANGAGGGDRLSPSTVTVEEEADGDSASGRRDLTATTGGTRDREGSLDSGVAGGSTTAVTAMSSLPAEQPFSSLTPLMTTTSRNLPAAGGPPGRGRGHSRYGLSDVSAISAAATDASLPSVNAGSVSTADEVWDEGCKVAAEEAASALAAGKPSAAVGLHQEQDQGSAAPQPLHLSNASSLSELGVHEFIALHGPARAISDAAPSSVISGAALSIAAARSAVSGPKTSTAVVESSLEGPVIAVKRPDELLCNAGARLQAFCKLFTRPQRHTAPAAGLAAALPLAQSDSEEQQ